MRLSILLLFIFAVLAALCACNRDEPDSPSLLADLQSRIQALEIMQHISKQELLVLQNKLSEIHYTYQEFASAMASELLQAAKNATLANILPNQ